MDQNFNQNLNQNHKLHCHPTQTRCKLQVLTWVLVLVQTSWIHQGARSPTCPVPAS